MSTTKECEAKAKRHPSIISGDQLVAEFSQILSGVPIRDINEAHTNKVRAFEALPTQEANDES